MQQYIRAIMIVIFCGLLGGCILPTNSENGPPAKMPTKDLLLNTGFFTADWEQIEMRYDDDYLDDDLDTFSVFFQHPLPYPNIATQRVSRFRSVDQARDSLDMFVKGDDYLRDPPDQKRFTYHSRIANQQVVHCVYDYPPPEGPNPHSAFCTAYLQYGAYVVQMSAYIDDHSLRYSDFAHVLEEIDKKMAGVINN